MAIVAGKYDIIHKRGDAYTIQFRIYDQNPDTEEITDIDITNYKLDMQIRTSADSDEVLLTPKLDKTNPKKGIFEWKITPKITEMILVGAGVYDIQLTIPNINEDLTQIVTFLEGSFVCVNDVTRPLQTMKLPPLAISSYAYGAQAQTIEVEAPNKQSQLDKILKTL